MKKTLHAFLSLLIVIATILAPMRQAQAMSPQGWALSAYSLPTTTITAIKNGVTASVQLAPSASRVAGVLVKGAGAAAIAYAVAQYGGDAIDWVLDPANNAVKVRYPATPGSGTLYVINGDCNLSGKTAYEACSVIKAKNPSRDFKLQNNDTWCADSDTIFRVTQQVCSTSTATPDKSIPLTEIAQKVIANAKSGNSASSDVVNAAVADAVNAGDVDKDLEDAAKCGAGTHMSSGTCVADTSSSDKDKPFDPSGIIAALQSLFSMLQGLLNSILTAVMTIPDLIKSVWDWAKTSFDYIKTTANTWKDGIVTEYQAVKDAVTKEYTDVRDWVYSKDDIKKAEDDSKLDIPDTPSQNVDTSVNFGGSCPANIEVDINVFSSNVHIPIFNFMKFCGFLSTYMRPVVILLASFWAVLIVGRSSNESS